METFTIIIVFLLYTVLCGVITVSCLHIDEIGAWLKSVIKALKRKTFTVRVLADREPHCLVLRSRSAKTIRKRIYKAYKNSNYLVMFISIDLKEED